MYLLPKSTEIKLDNNLVLAKTARLKEFRLLDDKSNSGKTLAIRRLQYESKPRIFKRKLFKLPFPIFRYGNLISLLNTKSTKFIDSNGLIFNYTKSLYVPLKYFKVLKFIQVPVGYVVVLENIHTRFLIPKAPSLDFKYAGVLVVGKGYILYSQSSTKLDDTRRKI